MKPNNTRMSTSKVISTAAGIFRFEIVDRCCISALTSGSLSSMLLDPLSPEQSFVVLDSASEENFDSSTINVSDDMLLNVSDDMLLNVSVDGNQAVATTNKGNINLVDCSSNKVISSWNGHKLPYNKICTEGEDAQLVIWDSCSSSRVVIYKAFSAVNNLYQVNAQISHKCLMLHPKLIPKCLMFEPDLDASLVVTKGQDPYGLACNLAKIVSVSVYQDNAQISGDFKSRREEIYNPEQPNHDTEMDTNDTDSFDEEDISKQEVLNSSDLNRSLDALNELWLKTQQAKDEAKRIPWAVHHTVSECHENPSYQVPNCEDDNSQQYYLCLRLRKNKTTSGSSPNTSSMSIEDNLPFGNKDRREFWFTLPSNTTEKIYYFLLQWLPDKYGMDSETSSFDETESSTPLDPMSPEKFFVGLDTQLVIWDSCLSPRVATNKAFNAGVTYARWKNDHQIATGSYDQFIWILDDRNPRKTLLETESDGGVWHIESRGSGNSEQHVAACMYGGFAILESDWNITYKCGEAGKELLYGVSYMNPTTVAYTTLITSSCIGGSGGSRAVFVANSRRRNKKNGKKGKKGKKNQKKKFNPVAAVSEKKKTDIKLLYVQFCITCDCYIAGEDAWQYDLCFCLIPPIKGKVTTMRGRRANSDVHDSLENMNSSDFGDVYDVKFCNAIQDETEGRFRIEHFKDSVPTIAFY